MDLTKKTGINLKKGSSISLLKDNGEKLHNVCVGLNWGAIEQKSFFGLLSNSVTVDLDGTAVMFDHVNEFVDAVYYNKLVSTDGSTKHSGDDRSGDVGGDDGLDNEVIQVDLSRVNNSVKTIFFFLISYKGQDFASVPFSKIRIFEGTKSKVNHVVATFNLSTESAFSGKTAMVMGKLVKENGDWTFTSIGEPMKTKMVKESIDYIQKNLL